MFPSAPSGNSGNSNRGSGGSSKSDQFNTGSPTIPMSPSSLFPSALQGLGQQQQQQFTIGSGNQQPPQQQVGFTVPRSVRVLHDIARGIPAVGSNNTPTPTTPGEQLGQPLFTPTTATPARTRNAVLGAFWTELEHLVTQFGGGAAAGAGTSSSRAVTPARVSPAPGNSIVAASPRNNNNTASPRSGVDAVPASPTSNIFMAASSFPLTLDKQQNFFNEFKHLCESASVIVHDLSSAAVSRNKQQVHALAKQNKNNANSKDETGSSGSTNESAEIHLQPFLHDLADYVASCCGMQPQRLRNISDSHLKQMSGRASTDSTTSTVWQQNQHGGNNNNSNQNSQGGGGKAGSSSATIVGGIRASSSASTITGAASTIAGVPRSSTATTAILAAPQGQNAPRRRQRQEVSAAASLVLQRASTVASHTNALLHGADGTMMLAAPHLHGSHRIDNALFEALGGPIHQQGIDIPPEKQKIFMPWTLPEPYPAGQMLDRVTVGRFAAAKFGAPALANNSSSNSNSSNQAQPQQQPQQQQSSSLGYSTLLDMCKQADSPDVYSKWVARNRALGTPIADGGDASIAFVRAANSNAGLGGGNSNNKDGKDSNTTNNNSQQRNSSSSSTVQRNNSNANNSAAGTTATTTAMPAITFPHNGETSGIFSHHHHHHNHHQQQSAATMMLSSSIGLSSQSSGYGENAFCAAVPREWLANFVHLGAYSTTESREAHGSKTPAWKPALPAQNAPPDGRNSPRMDGQAAAAPPPPPPPAGAASQQQQSVMTPLTL